LRLTAVGVIVIAFFNVSSIAVAVTADEIVGVAAVKADVVVK
jgi:hypothetical protein